jgi:glucose-1-phosphate thymidylyltransferase
MLDRGCDVRSSRITGYWKDTGDVADMLEVNRSVLDTFAGRVEGTVDDASELIGRVVVAAGARITRSRIVGPVAIGAGATITGSYIGPYTSVAAGCEISDSEIEYSIVLDNARIRGAGRIEASLIGREASVTPAPAVPNAHRLVLGDHSKVQIHV